MPLVPQLLPCSGKKTVSCLGQVLSIKPTPTCETLRCGLVGVSLGVCLYSPGTAMWSVPCPCEQALKPQSSTKAVNSVATLV